MEQTAVEWLIEELLKMEMFTTYFPFEKFEQAKEMEKEQIVDARLSLDKSTPFSYASYKAEQYYNAKFKQQ